MARTLAVLTAGIVALLAPGYAYAYGWPVKPFDQQHAIRGSFDDPRSGRSFHFGVDISVADGTAVYAVAPGTIYRYPDAVAVRQAGGHEFAYWHVEPVVSEHSFVRTDQLIGYVKAPWGHVHLAEWDGKTYVNPLRPGGLEPFSDETAPVIASIDVDASGGHFDATVDAYDPAPVAPLPPWQDARWTPEIIRWRLVRDDVAVADWRTAVDFSTWLKPAVFDNVYAPGTEQNTPGKPGRYVFWLFRGLTLPAGHYQLQVVTWDTRGNTATSSKSFDIAQDGFAGARLRIHIR